MADVWSCFNGAVLSRGRRPVQPQHAAQCFCASMEPSSAEDGDSSCITPVEFHGSASMEPSSAEDGDCGSAVVVSPVAGSFNGAVLSRGRRPGMPF